jgi:hypothetical protein
MKRREKYTEIWRSKMWDEIFNLPIAKNYRISFCTTCMGRLYNLKETLPKNIEDNKDYPNLEFVILDYNSNDGLGEWIKNNMMEHIESGRLVYYRTEEPKYFDMSHSRNIAFKVSTGDIVNNLDADNYTDNKDFTPKYSWASYLNMMANQCNDKALFTKGKQLRHGRIGFFKKDFMALGGYDEGLKGYGFDDEDLVKRSERLGFTLYRWGGQYYSRIPTSKKEKNVNLEVWYKDTEKTNKVISAENIEKGIIVANQGKEWGKAKLVKNFKESVEI